MSGSAASVLGSTVPRAGMPILMMMATPPGGASQIPPPFDGSRAPQNTCQPLCRKRPVSARCPCRVSRVSTRMAASTSQEAGGGGSNCGVRGQGASPHGMPQCSSDRRADGGTWEAHSKKKDTQRTAAEVRAVSKDTRQTADKMQGGRRQAESKGHTYPRWVRWRSGASDECSGICPSQAGLQVRAAPTLSTVTSESELG